MKLITYLTFAGDCEAALNFYKERLNGEILQISRMGDGQMETPAALKDKIMHARLKFGENELYMSDTFEPGSLIKGSNVSLTLQIDNTEQLNTLFTKLSDGGKVTMPLQDTFWGATFGMFTDRFGMHWMLNYEKS